MKPETGGETPHRFEALDSLRGVCACMLVLYHLVTDGRIHNSALVQSGFLFVDFFFVLSGFVIAASYGDRLAGGFSIPRFMGLRLGRIYPLHLLMLIVFLLFEIGFAFAPPGLAGRTPFAFPYDPGSFIACLLLIQPFVGPDGTPWNGPSWSIAVELWTYLVFALMFRVLGRWLALGALVLAAGSAAYLYGQGGRYLNVFHDGAMARCLYGFALGVVAYRLHRGTPGFMPTSLAGTAVEIVAVAATVLLAGAAGATVLSLAIPPLFFSVVLIFAREAGWISRALRTRPFLIVGAASYSIYMIHLFLVYRLTNALQLVQRLSHGRLALVETIGGASHVGGGVWFGDLVSVLMLGLVIGLAHLTYRFVEKPAQRWSRRKVLGDHPRRGAMVAEREAPTF